MYLIADNLLWIYLITINLLGGIIFAYDKWAAIKNYRRIPELNLHIIELLGGVFAIFLFMYTLKHKNRKFQYYWVTWIVVMTFGFFICKFYSS